MKKLTVIVLLFLCVRMYGQTVFSHAVDTVIVARDSMTVIANSGHVFSVGDSVRANIWYVSNDSINWRALYGYSGEVVWRDSILIDTLPIYRYYCAELRNAATEYIVFKINTILYKSLEKPALSNNAGITKSDILLLRYDSIRLIASFPGLQPDTVIWRNAFYRTVMPVTAKGEYQAIGYVYNRKGEVIDSVVSQPCSVNFVYPLEKVIFRSWAGSNDGNPRHVDTLIIDTCVREYLIDTLRFAVGDAYKYQFIPVVHAFDKAYNFRHRWIHDGFAIVQTDSVLEFNPIDFVHTGSYVFRTEYRDTPASRWDFSSVPFRIVAHNTGNAVAQNQYIDSGTIYSASGTVVRQGVSGPYRDIIRDSALPTGVYFLRLKGSTIKFVK